MPDHAQPDHAQPDYVSIPDQHLNPSVAAVYDHGHADRFSPDDVGPTVDLLLELGGDGPIAEFAIGTGRIALPLAERCQANVQIYGIDFSEPMLDHLREKPGADRIILSSGDMTTTRVCSDASLVYLVFNTIGNLRTQAGQVACFQNAATHLAPGGRFVVEVVTPQIHRLPAGETIRPFDVSENHLGFDEYVDPVNQILISHHFYIDGDRARTLAGAFRYVWPSELDLMALLAGMQLEHRWADWHRNEFTADSPSHVSVWRKQ